MIETYFYVKKQRTVITIRGYDPNLSGALHFYMDGKILSWINHCFQRSRSSNLPRILSRNLDGKVREISWPHNFVYEEGIFMIPTRTVEMSLKPNLPLLFWLEISKDKKVIDLMVCRKTDPTETYQVFGLSNKGECWRYPGLPFNWGFRLTKNRRILELI